MVKDSYISPKECVWIRIPRQKPLLFKFYKSNKWPDDFEAIQPTKAGWSALNLVDPIYSQSSLLTQ